MNIASLFSNRKSFIRHKDESLTYQQLYDKILSASSYLSGLGINSKDRVAILSENNIDFIIIFFALWKLEAIPVPLNIRLTKKEIENLLNFSRAKLLLVNQNLANNFSDFNFPISFFSNEYPNKSSNNFEVDLNSDNDALIIFTSGTTGKPKGVVSTFKNIFSGIHIQNQVLNQSEEDKWLASLPFYHIGGLLIILRAFYYGTSLIIPSSLKAEDLISSIKNDKSVLASLVSTQLIRLLEIDSDFSDKFRLILLGGSLIEKKFIQKVLEKNLKVVKVYGSSETSAFVTALKLPEESEKIDSSGKALPPNKILIMNGEKKILNPFERGEVVIESPALFKEYLFDKITTQKKQTNNLYFSGDIGYLDNEGYLYIEARRTDLIISGGENINPFEIEEIILKYPGITEACVAGISDEKWGEVPAALLSSEAEINSENIIEFLKDKLAPYKIPKKIIFTDKLPRTSLGKIEREKVKILLNSEETKKLD